MEMWARNKKAIRCSGQCWVPRPCSVSFSLVKLASSAVWMAPNRLFFPSQLPKPAHVPTVVRVTFFFLQSVSLFPSYLISHSLSSDPLLSCELFIVNNLSVSSHTSTVAMEKTTHRVPKFLEFPFTFGSCIPPHPCLCIHFQPLQILLLCFGLFVFVF